MNYNRYYSSLLVQFNTARIWEIQQSQCTIRDMFYHIYNKLCKKYKGYILRDNSLPFYPHHIKRGKKYYSENDKAEVIMPDLMILIFYPQHAKMLYMRRWRLYLNFILGHKSAKSHWHSRTMDRIYLSNSHHVL